MRRIPSLRRAPVVTKEGAPAVSLGGLRGIWGRPYIDLEPYIDTSAFAAIDDEICLALTEVDVGYTGGSHRSMGIVPPSLRGEPWIDYGEVIARMSNDEFARFAALGDEPDRFDPDPARRGEYEFGEEREHPLNLRQMRWLEYKYGVYFPWKVFYELIPTRDWDDKSTGLGKAFTEEALARFPLLVAFVKSLPFAQIGRCNIMGLAAHDHGTVHHDRSHEDKVAADHFISFCPRGDKRLFLWDEDAQKQVFVESRVYWFNDCDYHGVAADPFFRYSVRVDGFFRPELLAHLRRVSYDGAASGPKPPAGGA